MYGNGQGVPENGAEAYFWFSLAVANGGRQDEVRQNRDYARAQLTSSQIAEVQARAAQWKPKGEK